MITKRQFFAIILMFLTVFLLFQGLQFGKGFFIETDKNQYSKDIGLGADSARAGALVVENGRTETTEQDAVIPVDEAYYLYVGAGSAGIKRSVSEWAYYTGKKVIFKNALASPAKDNNPEVLMIDAGTAEMYEETVSEYLKQGTDVFMLSIPGVSVIENSEYLKEMLGIYRIRSKDILLHGVRLFSGFLLGGERIYETEDDDDERQDLQLQLPWYTVRNGTKTFMQGILSSDDLKEALENDLKNEDMPAIVWKNYYKKGEVYAVNGDYINNNKIGIGMIEAMMTQRKSYDLYPVINSLVFSLVNFPIAADENSEEVIRIYGATITRTESDIISPMLYSLTSRYGYKPTVYFTSKYDYTDGAPALSGILKYYLDTMTEVNGELALSSVRKGNISIKEKLDAESDYRKNEGRTYPYSALFVSRDEAFAAAGIIKASDKLDSIKTLVLPDDQNDIPLIGYISSDITYQASTENPIEHTFTDDLEFLGIQTLLCYGSFYYDMADSFFPVSEEYEWHKASQNVLSNLITYNMPLRATSKVTATECDTRIRRFLALDFSETRNGDMITIKIENFDEEAFFILRTHNEEIENISGGSVRKIEKDAYLITAEKDTVEIKVKFGLSDMIKIKGGDGQ